ncbi:putative had superfamily [Phaeomoniella chlamydospora]|uniref:Putative had superfamily n=1 Tax=Phaeomoniella chlamydospora TaxID=158046 RepID=A0A0G2GBB3_PHACM|nr:putative had superfamily [Phaeomoniella chlamydospora]
MFQEMRSSLGIPKSTDILGHIRSLPTRPQRAEAVRSIQSIERRAMARQRPQPFLLELMQYLDSRGIRKGLCTRNFPAPVQHLRDNFLKGIEFEGVVTRDTPGIRAKPEGDGLWMIVEGWDRNTDNHSSTSTTSSETTIPTQDAKGPITDLIDQSLTSSSSPSDPATPHNNPYIPPSRIPHLRQHHGHNILMVGDSIDDLLAGRNAGAATVLLVNEENSHLADHEACDLGVRTLRELRDVLEKGFVGSERGL